jgi:hypothetical protein
MPKFSTSASTGLTSKRVRTDARLSLAKFYPPRVSDTKTNYEKNVPRDYKKDVLKDKINISFGETGFSKEDFNV